MSVAGFTPRIVDEEMWRFTPQGIRFSLSPFSRVEIIAETFSPGGLVRAINLGLVSSSNIRFVRRTIELGIDLSGDHDIKSVCGKRQGFTTSDNIDQNGLNDIESNVAGCAVPEQRAIWLVAATHIQNAQVLARQPANPSGKVQPSRPKHQEV